MATMNGEHSQYAGDTFEGLGKRKRISSQEPSNTISVDREAQQDLEAILNLLRSYDPSPSLLKYPLPATPGEPHTKRARLAKADVQVETIEIRVASGFYKSPEQMMKDIERVASAMLDNEPASSEQANGESKTQVIINSKARAQIVAIGKVLPELLQRIRMEERSGAELDLEENPSAAQVLTLRTQTDRGPRQVYSGLQHRITKSEEIHTVEEKLLPNGIELAEVASLEAHAKRKIPQETRTIGEVFRPHRNLKTMESPHTRRTNRSNSLDFVSPTSLAFDRATAVYKPDYNFQKLPAAQWVQYLATAVAKDDEKSKAKDKNDVALFTSAYSSFAPSCDASNAVVSERERNQLWWKKSGKKRFRRLFALQYPEDEATGVEIPVDESDEFADVVANFEPEEPIEVAVDQDGDALLTEISDLLETLSSYQRLRSLDSPENMNEPSSDEFDTYELLKSQLVLLINSLPPFAVSKLDGDQLQSLNISKKIIGESEDFPGSAEVDDFTLQRRKAVLVAASAASRTNQSAPVTTAARPNYQTPGPATAYNPRTRYTTSTPHVAPYSTSVPQSFQTPRPAAPIQRPSYPQQSYQQNTTTPSYSAQPSIQQFQRPIQNGYNYSPNTPSYMQQRPSLPSAQASANYQQQQNAVAGNLMRSASPQKPLTNGQSFTQANQAGYAQSQQQRAETPGTLGNMASLASPEQRMKIEQMRAHQAQQVQRQGSGTPGYDATAVGGRERGTSAAVSVGGDGR